MKQKQTPQVHHQHLTLEDRINIETALNEGKSLRQIAISLGKSPSSISREVKKHRCLKGRRSDKILPKCANYSECTVHGLCPDSRCYKYQCRSCMICKTVCPEYVPGKCLKPDEPPYVCNACTKLNSCTYERFIYVAKYADDVYRDTLTSAREGINQTPEKLQEIDQLISPLIKKGQPIAHIYAAHGEEIGCSRTTLYNYIDKSVFTVRNIDLPRKVKYKPRKNETKHSTSSDGLFRIGRTYEDFCNYIAANPFIPVVEMDTVLGKRDDEKAILTLFFRNCSLMLLILLPDKTQEAVICALNDICHQMGVESFKRLFPVILTDNGTEFQNPEALECDTYGEIKTKIFYCHPNCSWEKGMIEKNHEFIRYILPKGTSFERLEQKDITLVMNHINSVARDSLNGYTPFKLSQYLLDPMLHEVLNLQEIEPNEVTLKPSLLRKTKA